MMMPACDVGESAFVTGLLSLAVLWPSVSCFCLPLKYTLHGLYFQSPLTLQAPFSMWPPFLFLPVFLPG